VHPAGCLAADCRYLYFYDDDETGQRFMGCLNKVFGVEIDIEVFREAERTRPRLRRRQADRPRAAPSAA